MRNMAQQASALPLSDPRKAAEAPAQPSGDPRPLIVIDPGHGGPDTGAKVGDGEIMEKHMVLDFSMTLRDQLEKSGKYRVVLTRIDDTFIPLGERVKMARQRQAALFISIHADSLPKAEGDVQGATVYTLSDKASDSEAAKLAEAENRSDVVAGIDLSREPGDVADILIDLAQRETKGYSHQFARTLVGEMKSAMRLHKKPLKSASFVVLKAPDVPSVLVELGYMTNKQDLKLLMSEGWRAKAAESMVQAVDAFFRTRVAGADAGAARR
jgi:N-acetylmuramoyl-L-alanine amidase